MRALALFALLALLFAPASWLPAALLPFVQLYRLWRVADAG